MDARLGKLRHDQQLLILLVIVVAVVFMTLSFLKTRAEARPSVHGEAQIRSEIQAMRSDIKAMSQMSSLETVDAYWMALFDTAARSGLILKMARVPDYQRYRGPLKSRTGVIEGPTDIVLTTLRHLHQKMPIFMYSVKIEGQMAEVTVSVVGV